MSQKLRGRSSQKCYPSATSVIKIVDLASVLRKKNYVALKFGDILKSAENNSHEATHHRSRI